MAKEKAPSVLNVQKTLNNKSLLPVYFLFGEDGFSLNKAVKDIEIFFAKMGVSDFDKESVSYKDRSLSEIIIAAQAFPFGSEKKLLIVKDFDLRSKTKDLAEYVKNPADFTTLVLIYDGAITKFDNELFGILFDKNFIFEARALKGQDLVNWLTGYAEENGKQLSYENAQYLISLIGDDRSLIEPQILKIFSYVGEAEEITFDAIKKLSSVTKEYTIFDLQNAIGEKDKKKSLEIAYNMLDTGKEFLYILTMLTKYFAGLAQINELEKDKIPPDAAARAVGTHRFYYPNYVKARKLYTDAQLANAVKALFNADLSVKTGSVDPKTLITVLIADLLK
jgi:DNA polymerase-3 subunit delta